MTNTSYSLTFEFLSRSHAIKRVHCLDCYYGCPFSLSLSPSNFFFCSRSISMVHWQCITLVSSEGIIFERTEAAYCEHDTLTTMNCVYVLLVFVVVEFSTSLESENDDG
jgi:hypothetical protein